MLDLNQRLSAWKADELTTVQIYDELLYLAAVYFGGRGWT